MTGRARVQPLGGRSIECLQRNVDGTGNVLGAVFFGSENVNQLSALLNELLDAMTVDHRRHVDLPTAADSARRGVAEQQIGLRISLDVAGKR
jgi:hypothetical protein